MKHITKIKEQIFDFEKFKNDGESFFRRLCSELSAKQIPIQNFTADHLCFRVEDMQDYTYYKNSLCKYGTLLTEAVVNGRPISTFRLKIPFLIENQIIDLVELPSPKIGTNYKIGFEHAEFVISEHFDIFKERFPHLHFAESTDKVLNSELIHHSEMGTVKFHHLGLDRVIEIESADIKDVVFDFDGTIINSREQIYEVNRIVFSEVLERHISLEEAINKFHPEFSRLFESFEVTCKNKKSSALQLWGQVAKKFLPETFDGVQEMLEKLKNNGKYRLHLWTARDEESARSILTSHNLDSYFTSRSFASSTHSKPHGNSLHFDWKSAPKNSILVIGDSPSDIHGSKNIGAIGAAALWDSNACKKKLVAAGAELYFRKPHELLEWLSVIK